MTEPRCTVCSCPLLSYERHPPKCDPCAARADLEKLHQETVRVIGDMQRFARSVREALGRPEPVEPSPPDLMWVGSYAAGIADGRGSEFRVGADERAALDRVGRWLVARGMNQ